MIKLLKDNKEENNDIFIQEIKHSYKITKNVINVALLLGSLGFFFAGVFSYKSANLIEILDTSKIIFFPQGLTMTIYGGLGLVLSINQILIINLGLGEGHNEFNKQSNSLKIRRKNSYFETIEISFPLSDIVRTINLKLKN